VIAIIAILAAVFVPVAGKMREQSEAAKCVSNMRQQYIGAMAFASDTGVLPRAADGGTYWFREIAPYLGYDPTKTGKDYPLFMCPKRPIKRLQEIVTSQGGSVSYGGYLANPALCGIPPNSLPVKRMSQFPKPASVWLIADGNGQAAAYIWDASTIEKRIAYDHKIGAQMKAQLLMLDGHATSKTKAEMFANEGNFWADPRIPD
jgi:type II secretory pathway pseudopilin PulG